MRGLYIVDVAAAGAGVGGGVGTAGVAQLTARPPVTTELVLGPAVSGQPAGPCNNTGITENLDSGHLLRGRVRGLIQ